MNKYPKAIKKHEAFLTRQYNKKLKRERRSMRFEDVPQAKYKDTLDISVMV